MAKLKYDSEAVIEVTKNPKYIFMLGYYKIKKLKYILKVDTETATESELVVGIKTLLNMVFIIL